MAGDYAQLGLSLCKKTCPQKEHMTLTNPRNRGFIVGMGGFMAGALVHSLLPPWDLWLRAAATGLACLAVSAVLAMTFAGPPKP